ncbi:MAG: hypothetical protein LBN02_01920 [Oscillospiraceae bacterium]|jgi:cell division GTPase FtsZ|nr:hypothetical protein [Oscillospiraceae bacterium]
MKITYTDADYSGDAQELRLIVGGINALLQPSDIINLDTQDLRALFGESGSVVAAVGHAASGVDAARIAVDKLRAETDISGATAAAIQFAVAEDFPFDELDSAAAVVLSAVSADATILFAATHGDAPSDETFATVIVRV